MTAACLKIPPAQTMDAFLAAARVDPTFVAYDGVRQLGQVMPNGVAWLEAYYGQEYTRLEGMDYQHAKGEKVLLLCAIGGVPHQLLPPGRQRPGDRTLGQRPKTTLWPCTIPC